MKPRKPIRALTAAVTIGLAAFVAMSSCDGSSTGSSNNGNGNTNTGTGLTVGQDNAVTVPAGTEVRLDLTVSPSSSYKITTSGSLLTTVSVYTASGLLLQSAPGTQGVNFSYSAAQQATYTVVVKATNSGESGAVLVNVTQTDGPDRFEPDNVRALATLVPADSSIQAHVLARNDTDWIKFDVKAGASYKVIVNSSASTYTYAYADSTISSYTSYTSGGTLTYKAAADGRAFVMITGYSTSSYGPYKVLVYRDTVGVDRYEPDDTRAQATLIPSDGTVQGNHFLQAGEDDWFKFNAEAGKAYKISISNFSSGEFYVYQDSTTTSGSYSSSTAYTIKATKTGRMFIDFSGYSSTSYGSYGISVAVDTTGIDRYEPDDTRAQATVLPADGTVQSHYLQAGEVDWLKFRADSGKTYKVTVSNFSNGEIYLYPDSTTSSYTTYGYTSASIKATKSGNIFIDFTGYSSSYSGAYGISVVVDTTVIDRYEPDNTRAQATLIPTNGTSQSHYLESGEDDWLKFDVEVGKAYKVTTSSSFTPDLYFYTDSSATSYSYSSSSTSYTVTPSKSGRMFVDFQGYSSTSSGAYTISVTEILPQNLANASTITTDSTVVTRSLTSSTDYHYFKFTADSGKVYALQTQGSTDTYLWLMAGDSSVITRRDDGGSSSSTTQKVAWLCGKSGTYYVGVRLYGSTTGSYTFTVTGHAAADFPDPSEPNNTQAQAYALTLGTQASLYFTSGDTDWVSVACVGGTTYTPTISSTASYAPFVGAWISSTGSVLATASSGTGFTPTADGTYYIRLTPSTSTTSSYLGTFSAYTIKVQ